MYSLQFPSQQWMLKTNKPLVRYALNFIEKICVPIMNEVFSEKEIFFHFSTLFISL